MLQLRLIAVFEVLSNSDFHDCSSDELYAPYAADVWLQLPAFGEFVNDPVCDGAYSDMLAVLAISSIVQRAIQTRDRGIITSNFCDIYCACYFLRCLKDTK